jgi:hypothetical protein
MTNLFKVSVGTLSDGTQVVADLSMGALGTEPISQYLLTETYNAETPAGFIRRPFTTGADVAQTYPAGVTLTLFAFEGAALIALGAAEVA